MIVGIVVKPRMWKIIWKCDVNGLIHADDFESHMKMSRIIYCVSSNKSALGVSCTCAKYMKNYICVHAIAYLVYCERLEIPMEAKSVPLGQKRKRGRPKRVSPALSLT